MTNEKHWTDDEEVLEDYVLSRIEDSVRARLDAHLKSCAQCRERVESEAGLAAGIRQFEASRIKGQLQALTNGRRRSVPLPHILSMAAAIVLIVGIGFYNRWFMNAVPQPAPLEIAEQQKEVSSTPKDTPPTRDDDKSVKKHEEVNGLGESTSTSKSRSNSQPSTAPEGFLADEKESLTAAVGSEPYELTGFLLRKEVHISGESESISGAAEKSARQEDIVVHQNQAALKDSEVRKTGNLVILRGEEKADRVAEPDGQVRCSIERVDSLFYLTIFMTQGNSLGDPRLVRARLAGPDSLVLVLDKAQLGLRLPSEFRGQIVPAE